MSYEAVEYFLDQLDEALGQASWSVVEDALPGTEFYQGTGGDWRFVIGASKERVEGTAVHKDTSVSLYARGQAERALRLARAATRGDEAHP